MPRAQVKLVTWVRDAISFKGAPFTSYSFLCLVITKPESNRMAPEIIMLVKKHHLLAFPPNLRADPDICSPHSP